MLGARAPRPHQRAQHAQFLKTWLKVISRSALIAGEGARAPSIRGLGPTQIDFLALAA